MRTSFECHDIRSCVGVCVGIEFQLPTCGPTMSHGSARKYGKLESRSKKQEKSGRNVQIGGSAITVLERAGLALYRFYLHRSCAIDRS
eukprot:scaffold2780_cov174-Amphora_coffeaeformis.AAC.11